MVLKPLKIRPPLHVWPNNSVARQKSEGQLFDQVTKDVKSVFTFSRWPLMAELKLKMAEFAVFFILLISALPLEVTFEM